MMPTNSVTSHSAGSKGSYVAVCLLLGPVGLFNPGPHSTAPLDMVSIAEDQSLPVDFNGTSLQLSSGMMDSTLHDPASLSNSSSADMETPGAVIQHASNVEQCWRNLSTSRDDHERPRTG
ncbi:hypothetical protein GBAR_LOCUS24797 [Geodia barretti]|uniref:Uncharacterized protein n=1 Tax=Geodia barretti TaxID=519541 RepID=A0AA35TB81_GEOBA|nr:hypothetical protein GBAR_LOCUS24797 [Geodia barretti]